MFDADTKDPMMVVGALAAADPALVSAIVQDFAERCGDIDCTIGGITATLVLITILETMALPGRKGEAMALAAVCLRARAEHHGPAGTPAPSSNARH